LTNSKHLLYYTHKALKGQIMKTVYHTKFEFVTVAKNGSEKLGVNAVCKFWVGESAFRMDLSQFANTKAEAEEKILKVLSTGADAVECVG